MRQNARALVQAAVLAALLTPFLILAGCDSGSPTANGVQVMSVSALAPRANETLDADKNGGVTTVKVLASGPAADDGKQATMWISFEATAQTGGAGNDGDRYVIFAVSVTQGTPQEVAYNLNGFMRSTDQRLNNGRIRVSTTEELNRRPDGSGRVYTISPVHFIRSGGF